MYPRADKSPWIFASDAGKQVRGKSWACRGWVQVSFGPGRPRLFHSRVDDSSLCLSRKQRRNSQPPNLQGSRTATRSPESSDSERVAQLGMTADSMGTGPGSKLWRIGTFSSVMAPRGSSQAVGLPSSGCHDDGVEKYVRISGTCTGGLSSLAPRWKLDCHPAQSYVTVHFYPTGTAALAPPQRRYP